MWRISLLWLAMVFSKYIIKANGASWAMLCSFSWEAIIVIFVICMLIIIILPIVYLQILMAWNVFVLKQIYLLPSFLIVNTGSFIRHVARIVQQILLFFWRRLIRDHAWSVLRYLSFWCTWCIFGQLIWRLQSFQRWFAILKIGYRIILVLLWK